LSRFPAFKCHIDEIHIAKRETVMETERDKTLEASQIAIQMEIDRKEYYPESQLISSFGIAGKSQEKTRVVFQ